MPPRQSKDNKDIPKGKPQLKSHAKSGASTAAATASASASNTAAAVSTPVVSLDQKFPNSMYLTSHKDCVEIAFEQAQSLVYINSFLRDSDTWASLTKHHALQSVMLYLADSLSEYLRRVAIHSNLIKDIEEHKAWEEARNIFKHLTQSTSEEKIFTFVNEAMGVIFQTFSQMAKVKIPNQVAIDEKEIETFISSLSLKDSKEDSMHDLMKRYQKVLQKETHTPKDNEEFYHRISQQIVPLINVLARPLVLQETDAAAPSALFDRATFAALRNLLKECGKLYKDFQHRFALNRNPLAFVRKGTWKILTAFLEITKKTICDKMGHERPDALTDEDVIAACKLAREINDPKQCEYAKPSDVDLSFSPKPVKLVSGDEKQSKSPPSLSSQSTATASMSAAVGSSASSPTASSPISPEALFFDQKRVPVIEELKTAASLPKATDEKKPKTISDLLQDIVQVKGGKQPLVPTEELMKCLHAEGKKTADKFTRINFRQLYAKCASADTKFAKANYKHLALELRARVIDRLVQDEQPVPIFKKFFDKLERLRRNIRLVDRNKDNTPLESRLGTIDADIKELQEIKTELERSYTKLVLPPDAFTSRHIKQICLLLHPKANNRIYDANNDGSENIEGILAYWRLGIAAQEKYEGIKTSKLISDSQRIVMLSEFVLDADENYLERNHLVETHEKVKKDNVFIVEDTDYLIKNILGTAILYVDDLVKNWPSSRQAIKQQLTKSVITTAATATAEPAATAASVSLTPPSQPTAPAASASSKDKKDDKKSDFVALDENQIASNLVKPATKLKTDSKNTYESALAAMQELEDELNGWIVSLDVQAAKNWCAKRLGKNFSSSWPGFAKVLNNLSARFFRLTETSDRSNPEIDLIQNRIKKAKEIVASKNPVKQSASATAATATAAATAVDAKKSPATAPSSTPFISKANDKKDENKDNKKSDFKGFTVLEILKKLENHPTTPQEKTDFVQRDTYSWIRRFQDQVEEYIKDKVSKNDVEKWHKTNIKNWVAGKSLWPEFVEVMTYLSAQVLRCAKEGWPENNIAVIREKAVCVVAKCSSISIVFPGNMVGVMFKSAHVNATTLYEVMRCGWEKTGVTIGIKQVNKDLADCKRILDEEKNKRNDGKAYAQLNELYKKLTRLVFPYFIGNHQHAYHLEFLKLIPKEYLNEPHKDQSNGEERYPLHALAESPYNDLVSIAYLLISGADVNKIRPGSSNTTIMSVHSYVDFQRSHESAYTLKLLMDYPSCKITPEQKSEYESTLAKELKLDITQQSLSYNDNQLSLMVSARNLARDDVRDEHEVRHAYIEAQLLLLLAAKDIDKLFVMECVYDQHARQAQPITIKFKRQDGAKITPADIEQLNDVLKWLNIDESQVKKLVQDNLNNDQKGTASAASATTPADKTEIERLCASPASSSLDNFKLIVKTCRTNEGVNVAVITGWHKLMLAEIKESDGIAGQMLRDLLDEFLYCIEQKADVSDLEKRLHRFEKMRPILTSQLKSELIKDDKTNGEGKDHYTHYKELLQKHYAGEAKDIDEQRALDLVVHGTFAKYFGVCALSKNIHEFFQQLTLGIHSIANCAIKNIFDSDTNRQALAQWCDDYRHVLNLLWVTNDNPAIKENIGCLKKCLTEVLVGVSNKSLTASSLPALSRKLSSATPSFDRLVAKGKPSAMLDAWEMDVAETAASLQLAKRMDGFDLLARQAKVSDDKNDKVLAKTDWSMPEVPPFDEKNPKSSFIELLKNLRAVYQLPIPLSSAEAVVDREVDWGMKWRSELQKHSNKLGENNSLIDRARHFANAVAGRVPSKSSHAANESDHEKLKKSKEEFEAFFKDASEKLSSTPSATTDTIANTDPLTPGSKVTWVPPARPLFNPRNPKESFLKLLENLHAVLQLSIKHGFNQAVINTIAIWQNEWLEELAKHKGKLGECDQYIDAIGKTFVRDNFGEIVNGYGKNLIRFKALINLRPDIESGVKSALITQKNQLEVILREVSEKLSLPLSVTFTPSTASAAVAPKKRGAFIEVEDTSDSAASAASSSANPKDDKATEQSYLQHVPNWQSAAFNDSKIVGVVNFPGGDDKDFAVVRNDCEVVLYDADGQEKSSIALDNRHVKKPTAVFGLSNKRLVLADSTGRCELFNLVSSSAASAATGAKGAHKFTPDDKKFDVASFTLLSDNGIKDSRILIKSLNSETVYILDTANLKQTAKFRVVNSRGYTMPTRLSDILVAFGGTSGLAILNLKTRKLKQVEESRRDVSKKLVSTTALAYSVAPNSRRPNRLVTAAGGEINFWQVSDDGSTVIKFSYQPQPYGEISSLIALSEGNLAASAIHPDDKSASVIFTVYASGIVGQSTLQVREKEFQNALPSLALVGDDDHLLAFSGNSIEMLELPVEKKAKLSIAASDKKDDKPTVTAPKFIVQMTPADVEAAKTVIKISKDDKDYHPKLHLACKNILREKLIKQYGDEITELQSEVAVQAAITKYTAGGRLDSFHLHPAINKLIDLLQDQASKLLIKLDLKDEDWQVAFRVFKSHRVNYLAAVDLLSVVSEPAAFKNLDAILRAFDEGMNNAIEQKFPAALSMVAERLLQAKKKYSIIAESKESTVNGITVRVKDINDTVNRICEGHLAGWPIPQIPPFDGQDHKRSFLRLIESFWKVLNQSSALGFTQPIMVRWKDWREEYMDQLKKYLTVFADDSGLIKSAESMPAIFYANVGYLVQDEKDAEAKEALKYAHNSTEEFLESTSKKFTLPLLVKLSTDTAAAQPADPDAALSALCALVATITAYDQKRLRAPQVNIDGHFKNIDPLATNKLCGSAIQTLKKDLGGYSKDGKPTAEEIRKKIAVVKRLLPGYKKERDVELTTSMERLVSDLTTAETPRLRAATPMVGVQPPTALSSKKVIGFAQFPDTKEILFVDEKYSPIFLNTTKQGLQARTPGGVLKPAHGAIVMGLTKKRLVVVSDESISVHDISQASSNPQYSQPISFPDKTSRTGIARLHDDRIISKPPHDKSVKIWDCSKTTPVVFNLANRNSLPTVLSTKLVAFGGEDGFGVMNIETGNHAAGLAGFTVTALAYSEQYSTDEEIGLIISRINKPNIQIDIWRVDAATGALSKRLFSFPTSIAKNIVSILSLPSGLIATLGHTEDDKYSVLTVWDPKTEWQTASLQLDKCDSLVWLGDGLLMAYSLGKPVRMFDLPEERQYELTKTASLLPAASKFSREQLRRAGGYLAWFLQEKLLAILDKKDKFKFTQTEWESIEKDFNAWKDNYICALDHLIRIGDEDFYQQVGKWLREYINGVSKNINEKKANIFFGSLNFIAGGNESLVYPDHNPMIVDASGMREVVEKMCKGENVGISSDIKSDEKTTASTASALPSVSTPIKLKPVLDSDGKEIAVAAAMAKLDEKQKFTVWNFAAWLATSICNYSLEESKDDFYIASLEYESGEWSADSKHLTGSEISPLIARLNILYQNFDSLSWDDEVRESDKLVTLQIVGVIGAHYNGKPFFNTFIQETAIRVLIDVMEKSHKMASSDISIVESEIRYILTMIGWVFDAQTLCYLNNFIDTYKVFLQQKTLENMNVMRRNLAAALSEVDIYVFGQLNNASVSDLTTMPDNFDISKAVLDIKQRLLKSLKNKQQALFYLSDLREAADRFPADGPVKFSGSFLEKIELLITLLNNDPVEDFIRMGESATNLLGVFRENISKGQVFNRTQCEREIRSIEDVILTNGHSAAQQNVTAAADIKSDEKTAAPEIKWTNDAKQDVELVLQKVEGLVKTLCSAERVYVYEDQWNHFGKIFRAKLSFVDRVSMGQILWDCLGRLSGFDQALPFVKDAIDLILLCIIHCTAISIKERVIGEAEKSIVKVRAEIAAHNPSNPYIKFSPSSLLPTKDKTVASFLHDASLVPSELNPAIGSILSFIERLTVKFKAAKSSAEVTEVMWHEADDEIKNDYQYYVDAVSLLQSAINPQLSGTLKVRLEYFCVGISDAIGLKDYEFLRARIDEFNIWLKRYRDKINAQNPMEAATLIANDLKEVNDKVAGLCKDHKANSAAVDAKSVPKTTASGALHDLDTAATAENIADYRMLRFKLLRDVLSQLNRALDKKYDGNSIPNLVGIDKDLDNKLLFLEHHGVFVVQSMVSKDDVAVLIADCKSYIKTHKPTKESITHNITQLLCKFIAQIDIELSPEDIKEIKADEKNEARQYYQAYKKLLESKYRKSRGLPDNEPISLVESIIINKALRNRFGMVLPNRAPALTNRLLNYLRELLRALQQHKAGDSRLGLQHLVASWQAGYSALLTLVEDEVGKFFGENLKVVLHQLPVKINHWVCSDDAMSALWFVDLQNAETEKLINLDSPDINLSVKDEWCEIRLSDMETVCAVFEDSHKLLTQYLSDPKKSAFTAVAPADTKSPSSTAAKLSEAQLKPAIGYLVKYLQQKVQTLLNNKSNAQINFDDWKDKYRNAIACLMARGDKDFCKGVGETLESYTGTISIHVDAKDFNALNNLVTGELKRLMDQYSMTVTNDPTGIRGEVEGICEGKKVTLAALGEAKESSANTAATTKAVTTTAPTAPAGDVLKLESAEIKKIEKFKNDTSKEGREKYYQEYKKQLELQYLRISLLPSNMPLSNNAMVMVNQALRKQFGMAMPNKALFLINHLLYSLDAVMDAIQKNKNKDRNTWEEIYDIVINWKVIYDRAWALLKDEFGEFLDHNMKEFFSQLPGEISLYAINEGNPDNLVGWSAKLLAAKDYKLINLESAEFQDNWCGIRLNDLGTICLELDARTWQIVGDIKSKASSAAAGAKSDPKTAASSGSTVIATAHKPSIDSRPSEIQWTGEPIKDSYAMLDGIERDIGLFNRKAKTEDDSWRRIIFLQNTFNYNKQYKPHGEVQFFIAEMGEVIRACTAAIKDNKDPSAEEVISIKSLVENVRIKISKRDAKHDAKAASAQKTSIELAKELREAMIAAKYAGNFEDLVKSCKDAKAVDMPGVTNNKTALFIGILGMGDDKRYKMLMTLIEHGQPDFKKPCGASPAIKTPTELFYEQLGRKVKNSENFQRLMAERIALTEAEIKSIQVDEKSDAENYYQAWKDLLGKKYIALYGQPVNKIDIHAMARVVHMALRKRFGIISPGSGFDLTKPLTKALRDIMDVVKGEDFNKWTKIAELLPSWRKFYDGILAVVRDEISDILNESLTNVLRDLPNEIAKYVNNKGVPDNLVDWDSKFLKAGERLINLSSPNVTSRVQAEWKIIRLHDVRAFCEAINKETENFIGGLEQTSDAKATAAHSTITSTAAAAEKQRQSEAAKLLAASKSPDSKASTPIKSVTAATAQSKMSFEESVGRGVIEIFNSHWIGDKITLARYNFNKAVINTHTYCDLGKYYLNALISKEGRDCPVALSTALRDALVKDVNKSTVVLPSVVDTKKLTAHPIAKPVWEPAGNDYKGDFNNTFVGTMVTKAIKNRTFFCVCMIRAYGNYFDENLVCHDEYIKLVDRYKNGELVNESDYNRLTYEVMESFVGIGLDLNSAKAGTVLEHAKKEYECCKAAMTATSTATVTTVPANAKK